MLNTCCANVKDDESVDFCQSRCRELLNLSGTYKLWYLIFARWWAMSIETFAVPPWRLLDVLEDYGSQAIGYWPQTAYRQLQAFNRTLIERLEEFTRSQRQSIQYRYLDGRIRIWPGRNTCQRNWGSRSLLALDVENREDELFRWVCGKNCEQVTYQSGFCQTR